MSFDTSASDFVTIGELARAWRCTEQHVYAMIRRGYLPAHRIGRRVIVSRLAAQKFLEQNATASAAA
jgi:excisionase family DNA binding protein